MLRREIAAVPLIAGQTLPREQMVELDSRARAYVRDLAGFSAIAPEFGRLVDQLAFLGRKEIADAAGLSAIFLNRSARAIDREAALDTEVARLRPIIDTLDPGRPENLRGRRKLFGLIPRGNAMADYFDRYKLLQSELGGTLARLASSKDDLLKDNAQIAIERQTMARAMGRLAQMIHLAKTLGTMLRQAMAELAPSDPGKAEMLETQALFHVGQRARDMQAQMTVSAQGFRALELIQQNNLALVAGIDRISATTLAALRIAVAAAGTLTRQHMVLDGIAALNDAAAQRELSSAARPRRPSARIEDAPQCAAGSDLAGLQQAFDTLHRTLDDMDSFSAAALRSLQADAQSLAGEVTKVAAATNPADPDTNDGPPGAFEPL
jgi:uncharacterized protein YaaN involved in tellurite resistance